MVLNPSESSAQFAFTSMSLKARNCSRWGQSFRDSKFTSNKMTSLASHLLH